MMVFLQIWTVGLLLVIMGKYFEQKIINIRSQFDNDLSSVPDDPQTVSSVTEATVPQFQRHPSAIQAPSKTPSLDPAPSKLVAQCDALLPAVTRIINLSL